MNTALNRTTIAYLTNKSGGNLTYGDVVILDNTNANGFTTTTTAALATRGLGVIFDVAGIANDATGAVAVGGWCPRINLDGAATVGQFVYTSTVAGQGTPHASPQTAGDFAVVLEAGTAPPAILFGTPNPTAGSGDVVADNTLTAGLVVIGAGTTHVDVLAAGSDGDVLTQAAGVASWAAASGGAVVQVVNTQTGAVATGTTTIPDDDTIPQNTEGDEYMTLAITPTDAANKLAIDVVFHGGNNNASRWMTVCLYQDTTANALACGREYNSVATAFATVNFRYTMTAGTTSATTFKVRAGADLAGTTTFNGQSSARKLGGVLASSITITEYVP